MHVRTLPPARLARAALVAAWACAASLGAQVCFAAPCPVELRGPPSEPWHCARIEIDLEPNTEGARLTFVTLDGRRAERRLAHPDQLVPSVVALGIGGASELSTPGPEVVPLAAPLTPVRAADVDELVGPIVVPNVGVTGTF